MCAGITFEAVFGCCRRRRCWQWQWGWMIYDRAAAAAAYNRTDGRTDGRPEVTNGRPPWRRRGFGGTWPPTSRLPMFNKLPPTPHAAPGVQLVRPGSGGGGGGFQSRYPVIYYIVPGLGFSYIYIYKCVCIIIIIYITAIFLIFTLPRVHCLPPPPSYSRARDAMHRCTAQHYNIIIYIIIWLQNRTR